MKPIYYIVLSTLIFSLKIQAQVSNKIETIAIIELLDDNSTTIDQDTIPLSAIHKRLSQRLDTLNLSENVFPSITLITNASVSENSIENIKYQIRSTPIQLINLQRKIVTNYDGIEVTQNVLDQYNALINYWNSLTSEERFYRKTDLNFVESVALNMSLNQRIRNEKLPGYLPFVKQEAKHSPLSTLEKDSDLTYKYILQQDTLDEANLKEYSKYPYRLKRRILDEEKVVLIELVLD